MRPRPSPRLGLAGALVAVAIAVVACGGDDGQGGPDPAELVPADTPLFVDVVVRPEGEVAAGAEAAIEQLTDNDDPGGLIVEQVDDLFAQQDAGVTYEEDVEPWLGQRAGVYLSDFGPDAEPTPTLMFSVTDEAAAQETVERLNEADGAPRTVQTYEGVSYSLDDEDSAVGFVDEFLVIGSQATFEAAVDASRGDDLAADDAYVELIDLAESDRLITVFLDAPTLTTELAASGAAPEADVQDLLRQLLAGEDGAILGWATAASDRITVELSGAAGEDPTTGGSDLLARLPGDAWLALAAPNIGASLGELLAGLAVGNSLDLGTGVPELFDPALIDELGRDLGWVGDAAAFVGGTSLLGIGAGLIAETTDPAASAAALAGLRDSLERGGEVEVGPTGRGTGFRIGVPGLPLGADVVQEGDLLVAAGGSASVEQLLDPSGGDLESSEAFQRAVDGLGSDFDTNLYLSFVDLLGLLNAIPGVTDDPDFQSAAQVLDGLDYLIGGNRLDGDLGALRVVLGLRQGAENGDAASAAIVP